LFEIVILVGASILEPLLAPLSIPMVILDLIRAWRGE